MAVILLKQFKSRGVERRVISSVLSARRVWRGLLAAWVVFGLAAEASALREVRGPVFAKNAPAAAPAPVPPKPPMDELVYKDGDRVRGRFIERSGDLLVFQSDRFGLLRVPATDAEVILVKPPTPQVAAVVEQDDQADVAVERWPFSPLAMTRALKQFFGSWHGRFSAGAEILQDVSDHNSVTLESRLQRKWKGNEVQLNGRFDYSAVNEQTATDMVRADGLWRHDFPGRLFAVYRPSLEWNRAYFSAGMPSDYVLLQQEVGAGVNFLNAETRKLRVGISENVFDTWVTPTQTHISQTVESIFTEFEAKLPWRITLTNRGVWYYSIIEHTDGWENRFEISKKLTETLTIGGRHETRRNNPDVRSADYERLRLLFGFDF